MNPGWLAANIQYRSEISVHRIRSLYAYIRIRIRVYSYTHTRILVYAYAHTQFFVIHCKNFLCLVLLRKTKEIAVREKLEKAAADRAV